MRSLTSEVMARSGVTRNMLCMLAAADDNADQEDPAAFVERFRTFWRDPHGVPLSTLLKPDVRLVQPLTDEVRGMVEALAWRQSLLRAMPSLRAEVEDWSARDDLLFIAFRLHASEPTYQLQWRAVDRFRLQAGLAIERFSYFDSVALLSQVARQPPTWPRFLAWAWREWRAQRGERST
jgi:hypothetical protein